MSSKNVATKASSKAAQTEKKSAKSAAKDSANNSKAKIVKKVEKKAEPAKKSATKNVEEKKAPAKAAAKASAPKKAEPAPAKKATETKSKAAPAKATSAKPAPAKATSTKAAPAKAAPAKASTAKAAPVKAVAPAKKDEKAEAAKVSASKSEAKSEAKAETKTESVAKQASSAAPAVTAKPKDEPVAEAPKKQPVENTGKKGTSKSEPTSFSILLPEGKKLCKYVMFFEIDEQEERANKKKVSSELKNLEKKPTSAIRHKISLAEETQEELTERILKELEEQNLAFTREAATQICTRCNKNLVSPEFWVDKHLGYCEECAAILKLGQSKEARKVEYQLGAMGGDSLNEADDEDFGDGPDAADLRETEEELAEFDD